MDTKEFLDKMNAIVNEYAESLQALEAAKNGADVGDDPQMFAAAADIARHNPFKGHILSKKDELVRNSYISALLAIFSEETDNEARTQQLILIGRIIASFNPTYDLKEYITASLKINEKFWDNFVEFIDKELAISFAVDTLLIAHVVPEKNSKKIYKNISNALEILNITKEEIKHAAHITQTILMQDIDGFIDCVSPVVEINYNIFLCYFEKLDFSYISYDLFKCKKVTGKLLIANMKIVNYNNLIDIDEYSSDEIRFFNCQFNKIRGIRSYKIHTEFEKCIFEENLLPNKPERDLGLFEQEKYDEDYIFLDIENSNITSSTFINCKTKLFLLFSVKTNLTKCTFENCEGIDIPCEYIIVTKQGKISDCHFANVEMRTKTKWFPNGGIFVIVDGEILNSSFTNCKSIGQSSYGRYGHYNMQIVRAIRATVNACKFSNCSCSTDNSSNRTVRNYILGLTDSKEINNTFIDCTSYHYTFSESCGSHNIGEIKE